MEIHTLCQFRVGTLLWEAQPGQLSLSVVVKATFSLVPDGEAVAAPDQVAVVGDLYWDNDPQKSLYAPSDSAPVKRRVDVILSGHAYAPDGAPVKELIAKLRVGDLVKAMRVTGDRLWTMPPGGAAGLVAGPPIPFVQMPLRYELAAKSADNPVGVDPSAPPEIGCPASPNIEPLDQHVMPGFGPVSPTWPSRRILLPDAVLPWAYAVAEGQPAGPAPHSFNFEFFNVAPRDQQIDLLRAGTVIELEHLNPRMAHLRTTLPAIRPQVFRMPPGGKRAEEIVLRCDTLWIDSDRGVAVLSFRGLTDVGGMEQAGVGELFVAADLHGKKLRFDKVEQQLREKTGPRAASAPAAPEEDPLAIRHDAVKTSQPPEAPQPTEPTRRLDRPGEKTGDINRAKRPTLPFTRGVAVVDKSASLPKDASAAKSAATKHPFRGDETVDRTKDIGQMPRRPALPFAPRLTSTAKRPEASPAPQRPAARRVEAPRAVVSPPKPGTAPQAISPPSEPDPDAITAEKSKKAPLAPLPPKPAMVPGVSMVAPQAQAPKPSEPEPPPPEPEPLGYREKNPAPAAPPPVEAAPEPAIPDDPDPSQVTIEQYAAISAELAQKGADRGAVLRGQKLSITGWAAIDRHWTRAIAEQTERGERTLLTSFDVAYVATQERLRRPIGVPEYARILVGLERGEVGRVLGDLELQLSDLMRLQRVWTKKIADTPKLAEELSQAVETARRG